MADETNEQETPKRWSARRKQQVVLRLVRGEPLDAVSRELGIEIFRLEQWRDQALDGMIQMLKDRVDDPIYKELDRAKRQIGELSMENELLRERCERKSPLVFGRSKK